MTREINSVRGTCSSVLVFIKYLVRNLLSAVDYCRRGSNQRDCAEDYLHFLWGRPSSAAERVQLVFPFANCNMPRERRHRGCIIIHNHKWFSESVKSLCGMGPLLWCDDVFELNLQGSVKKPSLYFSYTFTLSHTIKPTLHAWISLHIYTTCMNLTSYKRIDV
jgi:hypothetical protein